MEQLALGKLAVWRHETKAPKARVLLVHGISEHSGRHLTTADALNRAGIEVVRFDLRGSGLSGGRRQWVGEFRDYVTDVATVFNWISSSLEPLPLFLMGHSLGGGISIYFTAQYGKLLQGLILSSPGYRLGGAISPMKVRVGRVLSRFLPTLRIYAGDAGSLSRDRSVVEAYEKDPLAFRYNTLQQGQVILDAFADLPQQCRLIQTPTLIVHGTSDRVILPEGSFELLRSLGSTDRELHYLPLGYHELHQDLDKEKFFGLITQWIDRHLESASKASRPSKVSADAASMAHPR